LPAFIKRALSWKILSPWLNGVTQQPGPWFTVMGSAIADFEVVLDGCYSDQSTKAGTGYNINIPPGSDTTIIIILGIIFIIVAIVIFKINKR
jgi:hypothetical protein